jgi:hypothetical protein
MTTDKREPVKYTVLERSLVGNRIYEEGETAEYDGLPAENLSPQCDVGKARYQEYLDSNAERVKKMIEMNQDSGVGDQAAFQKQFLTMLAEQNAMHAESMAALQAQMVELMAKAVGSKAWTPPKGKADKTPAEDIA